MSSVSSLTWELRPHTSVSSVFSSSIGRDRTGELAAEPLLPRRCSPARTRSSSDQERMDASSPSISNRFVSSRGVQRNVSNMFVTSLRSTLVFADPRRRRRKASMRCSLIITANVTGRTDKLICNTIRGSQSKLTFVAKFANKKCLFFHLLL
jgi:hypothetical protein